MFSRYSWVQKESDGIPRHLVLGAIPIILFLAFLAGSVAFVFGSGTIEILQRHPRRTMLPIAGDRFLAFSGSAAEQGSARPLVTLSAAPTARLSGVTTHESGNWVRIPSLGVNVPLVLSKTMNDADVLNTLSEGVALYPNGIAPGEAGTTFISGHSTGEPWKGIYRFAFLQINQLVPGDIVLVDYHGTRYTYKITGQRTIDPRIVPSLDPSGDRPRLTLMACWPLWTTKNRILQDAELIAVNPLHLTGKDLAALGGT